MSNTIDQKVVEMQFDNRHFERNVSTTMSSLDKLKQSLNLSGAAKGFEDMNTAAKGVNLSGLSTAAETVGLKFNAMYTMADQALRNITNSAVNAGKRIVSALTIDPIKTGFAEYETQINAVQTILANTESKGTTLEDVNGALDQLNTYADKTIYNFTEMTRNIGTFTAAGVDLDTSVNAIQGIANLAAVSGSTSQQASTAMYQLSQALASGSVKLMDWNSVVNAGMGGQVFQDALKETARNHGVAIDAMIEKEGSFRETLKEEWLTSEILTETLSHFTMAAEEGSEQWNEFKKSLMDSGYTEEQALAILKLSNTATDAATKVKTFTQLWDTLKESAQSGWTQTWEIIVGDFEEAKELLTNVSNVIGEMIGNSANARNELLQGWKDAGGRSDLIEGLWSAFEGVMNIVKPIKEAFREIFPPATVDQLVKFTEGFKNLTAKFAEFTEKNSDKIKSTFKGIFSVLDIGWTIIKDLAGGIKDLLGNFKGFGGSVLDATSSFGDWLSNLRNTVKETDIFGKAIDKVTGFISAAISKIKEISQSVKDFFGNPKFEGFLGFFKGLWDIILKVGAAVGDVFARLGGKMANALTGDSSIFEILNSAFTTGAFAGIAKFIWGLSDGFDNVGGILENVTGILDDVRGCFEAYQTQLKAGALMKIAGAIAILAAAIFVVAMIDPDALSRSLGALAVMFGELLGSLAIFTKITTNMKGVGKSCAVMISMAIAITILAGAMKKISGLSWEEIGKGLVTVGALMAELMLFLKFAKIDGKMTNTAVGIVILSAAMLILAKAVKNFSAMGWEDIGKGLAAIGGLLLELGLFTKLTGNAKHVVSTGLSMILLGAAMKILVSVMQDFAGMSWEEIGRGLTAMAGALAEVTLAMNLMPKNSVGIGVGLIAAAAALMMLTSVMGSFAGMSWEEIARGLVAMGGALAILAISLNLMKNAVAGSAALIIAAGALAILTPILKTLGNMTWEEIAKGLVTIAGAFTIIGLAGLLLGPIAPAILAVAGAIALLGVGVLAAGAGLVLFSVGLTALGTSIAASATAIVAGLSVIVLGFINLIPAIAVALAQGIVTIIKTLAESAATIAESLLTLVTEVLASLANHAPQIVDSIMLFVIGILESFANRLPELIVAAMNVISAFFQGVVDALSGLDTTNLLKGIVGIGLMSGLMMLLGAVAGLVPGAMLGVLGMGVVIAELALVLAAIGGLAQIPGLSWLIEEGGNFLEKIGTAIGKFVGGIVGGVMSGVTSSLPDMATDLSDFMGNLEPFIEGAKGIDEGAMAGVKALAETILILTAADILNGLTSWLTGGSSLKDFGKQLGDLGTNLNEFSTNLGTFDESKVSTVSCAAEAIKVLAAAAKELPNEGGWAAKICGDNSLATFGSYLPDLALSLREFADNLGVFDEAKVNTVTCAANAIKSMAEAAEGIPNEGGWAAKICGDNSLATFGSYLPDLGKNLSDFAEALGTFGPSKIATVNSAVAAVKAIAGLADMDLASVNENIGGFGSKLKAFAEDLADFCNDISKVEYINLAVTNLKKILGAIADIADADAGALSTLGSSLKSIGGDAVKKFIDAFSNSAAKTNIKSAATNLMEKAIEGFKSKKESMSKTLSDMMTHSANSLKSQTNYQSFYSAGAYLAAGLAAGINSKVQTVAARAVAMVTTAINAAEEAAGIESPSKVFYRIGEFVVMGFTNALGDYSGSVYNTAYDMADSARSGFSYSISKMLDSLSGDMDIQPTIRPVLDLSDVRNGARSISSMFNSRHQVALANVGAISSTMTRNRQNGANDDVVSAINKLRGDIGGLGSTNYNINGISYNDDGGVSEAIRTIVRAARVERRS